MAPTAIVTTGVLLDESNGYLVKDQERVPVAADLKGATREKKRLVENTFALGTRTNRSAVLTSVRLPRPTRL